MISKFRWIFVVLLIVLGALVLSVFIRQNDGQVQLKLILFNGWFAQRTVLMSVAWLSIFSFLLGLLVTALFMSSTLFKHHFAVKRLQRENTALQKLIDRDKEPTHSSSSKK